MSGVRGPRTSDDASEYTVVGIVNDGAEVNQAVEDLRDLGVSGEDLTVVLKRGDPDEAEPFPEGTRYIVVPDDLRGLELTIGFAVVFAVSALLFAFTTPSIGAALFVFFIGLAALLALGSFVKVGVDPILIEMEVPADDSNVWNDEFENGKVLVFATTLERETVRHMWETLRSQNADLYVVERRLEPAAGRACEAALGGVADRGGQPVGDRTGVGRLTVGDVAALFLALQDTPGPDLSRLDISYVGTRGLTGVVMLAHIFFATLFVGFAVGAPLLKAFGKRRGDGRMDRLAYSLAHFNVLTFSFGATLAGLFLVLIFGFYPRVTATLFTHFFWFFPVIAMAAMVTAMYLFYIHFYRGGTQNIWAGVGAAVFILIWQTIMTGIDTFMVTGGGQGQTVRAGESISGIGSAFGSLLNPMFLQLNLHRIVGNLSWPAFAVAAWAGFMYLRSKKAEDRAYYDWAGSMGVLWGTIFLLFQPVIGFLITYGMKTGTSYESAELAGSASGPYDRLVGAGPGPESFTSNLLLINTVMVVGLFVLSNVAMYLGAARHPDRGGRTPIRFFGLVAAVTGVYAVSPLAQFPFLYMRYIMLAVMALATLGTVIAYVRSRVRFVYGSPGNGYQAVVLSLGVLAAVLIMSMGWMKSNSRAPYTIYGQPEYKVESEKPVTPDLLGTPEP